MNENSKKINWYPGHMAKTRRLLTEQIRSVDAVIELIDARAPISTRNPDLDKLIAGKARLVVLNKADMADDRVTDQWMAYFKRQGVNAMRFNSANGKAKDALGRIAEMTKNTVERMQARGANKTVRLMVVGIPNVGKSTFINKLHGQAVAKAQDRPGVTRSNSWIKVGPFLELMDTPGMLWPKLENQASAQRLAYLGSVRDEILDSQGLAADLMKLIYSVSPAALTARYKLPEGLTDPAGHELVEAACRGRGWLLSGGRFDIDRASAVILDEFRDGKIGRITLERPEEL